MAFSEWITNPTWLFAVAIAFGVGALLTESAMLLARRFQLHAVPNARSSHTMPTPQLGGIGASIPTLAFLFYVVVAAPHADRATHLFYYLFFGSSLLFFSIGLWDDLSNLSPKKKLLLQFVAGAMATEVLAAVFVGLSGAHARQLLVSQALAAAVWLVWVVGFVNAFNFMDGMNGKAGLFALSSLVFGSIMMTVAVPGGANETWFAQTTQIAPSSLALPMGITMGGVFGFMLFNCRTKALVFLGDCGSHFLGCFLATIAFVASSSVFGPGLSLLALVVLFMPFVYDVAYTLIRRGVAGKKVWEAHREHLYQRLMICGMSHMRVLAICATTYAICGLLAIVCVRQETLASRLVCLTSSITVMIAYTIYVVQVERRTRTAPQPQPGEPGQSAA